MLVENNVLTQPEVIQVTQRDQILERLWNEKRGKEQGHNPYTLYTTLSGPHIDIAQVTHDVLLAMQADPYISHQWAKRFGKVFVGIDPDGSVGSTIGRTDSLETKTLVALDSTKQHRPSELIARLPQGSVGEVVIHDQPQSIEAFLISYIHLIDELVWIRAQGYAQQNQYGSYARAIEDVLQHGFSVRADSEGALLKQATEQNLAIRLYGSKVHPQVPYVLGGVASAVENIPLNGSRYVDILGIQNKVQQVAKTSETQRKSENLDTGRTGVAVSITFGKEIHSGHLMLLAVADLVRSAAESPSPLFIINNNTGPRPAAALASFAQKSGLPIQEAAAVLSKGIVPADEVISSYRSRQDIDVAQELIDYLDQAGIDIFASVTSQNESQLQAAGFNTHVFSESATLQSAGGAFEAAISEKVPEWVGTGFLPLPVATKEVSIVQKGGLYTGVGKSAVAHTALMNEHNNSSCIMVDSCAGTRAAAAVLDNLIGETGYVKQAYGAGCGINGRIASGTGGEALTITDVNQWFERKNYSCSLRNALVFMAMTKPVSCEISHGLVESFYDFATKEDFLRNIEQSAQDLEKFGEDMQATMVLLRGRIGDMTSISDPKATGVFMHAESHLKKFTKQPKIDSQTCMGAIRKVEKLEESEEILLSLGYTQEQLPSASQQYKEGKRYFAFRINQYFNELRRIISLSDTVTSLTPETYQAVEQVVRICLRRLGLDTYIHI